jgi:glutathionyl-hydroquinone reductase
VIKNIIKDSYNEIFNQLYHITEGKIILGGSAGLKVLGILDRDINDLDVMLTHKDWIVYKSIIESKFRLYPNLQIKYDTLEYDVYTCFNKITKLDEFHLFVNYGQNIYINLNDIMVFNPKIHLKDKEMIAKSGQEYEKHIKDIEHIKKYFNEG